MDLLEKVETALIQLEENDLNEIPVNLSFADLRGIRRDILVAEYETELAAENLRAGLKLKKRKA